MPASSANPGRVNADFFTSSYRFSANVIVYKRRLVDVLSDPITNYLDLVDIYISRINDPGDIIATFPRGSVVKEEISFILLSSELEGISKERFFAVRENLPMFISVPSFEVTGQVQWGRQNPDIKKIMMSDVHKFLPVLDAKATNSSQPALNFQGPLALVNKSKIQIICVGQNS
jgi:hypothetical protein